VCSSSPPEEAPKTHAAALENRLYSFFVYDSITATSFQEAWDNLKATAINFDYAFRAIYTIQLIIKYWRVSAIDAPPADVRIDHMQDKGMASDQRSSIAKLAAFLAHPMTQIIVLLIFFGVILSVFLGMYLPIYNNYVEGCIYQPTSVGNGTMLSANVYAVSYSYASTDGDRTTILEIDQINVKRELDCTNEVDASLR
jgi:hypothetical protein